MTDHVAKVMGQWSQQRPELDVAPQGIIGRLHRLALRLTDDLVAVYAEHGLTEGDFDILATLRRQGPPYALTAGDLAVESMVSGAAITKRVDRCAAHGWVSRRVDPHDGRGRVVALTAAGRRLIDGAFTEHIANEQRLVAVFTVAERATLAKLLAKWASELGV